MNALILIDLQYDFMPGGALAVPHGDEVVEVANAAVDHFDLVVATRDWHPPDHGSFASQHPGKVPGDVIDLDGVQQRLWPDHCVQETHGAELHEDLRTDHLQRVVFKGSDRRIDSYSAFFDNARKRSTGLEGYLREQGVDDVYLMGLATDYCVKFSALDAVALGFRTFVIQDGCRGIDLNPGDIATAQQEMREAGVSLIDRARPVGDEPTTLFDGRFLKLLARGRWEYAERQNVSDIAGIVAVTDSNEAVFVEQFRIPVRARTIEWPAGLIGDGDAPESLEDGANRELEEETGYRAESFELLAKIPSSAGLTSETVSLLLAKTLVKVGEGGGTHSENITVHRVPLADVETWLRAREGEGMLVDPKIWGGLYFLLRRGMF